MTYRIRHLVNMIIKDILTHTSRMTGRIVLKSSKNTFHIRKVVLSGDVGHVLNFTVQWVIYVIFPVIKEYKLSQ